MKEFYLYAERSTERTIREIFKDFKIHILLKEDLKEKNFINKDIFFVLNKTLPIDLNEVFFLKNNVVIFSSKQINVSKNIYLNTKIFSGHTNINKLRDEITTFFASKKYFYKDLKILEDKITNTKIEKEVHLTPPEKDILILLFERKKIEKNFLLENVLKLKKDTETKTIESHLTRIRKKLLRINSQVEIISKENTVTLVF